MWLFGCGGLGGGGGGGGGVGGGKGCVLTVTPGVFPLFGLLRPTRVDLRVVDVGDAALRRDSCPCFLRVILLVVVLLVVEGLLLLPV